MNFEFSDDQKLLQEQARGFLEKHASKAEVRTILDGDAPYHEALWRGIAEMGWTGTAIPEACGGLGAGYLELCVIAEELGRALAPTPFSSSIYLAAECLLAGGSEAQKKAWLPKLAAGEVIGTLALSESPGSVTPKRVTLEAKGGKLTGSKIPVPDGGIADIAVVAARTGGDGGARSLSLFLVEMDADGVSREAVKTLDPTRGHARISFDGVAAEPLGETGAGWEILTRVFDRAAVLFAFEQLGGAQASLEMGRDYALERYAFGRPIGSFQAIKHRLADMYVSLELARSNCYFGAWALASDAPELPVAAAAARVASTQAYSYCAKENIQVHGGMGFTWEFDCHLYYRRSKLLGLTLGSLPVWKDRLIERLEARNVA